MTTFDAVDRLMHEALTRGVFPGAVVLAARDGQIFLHRAFGFANLFSRRAMTVDTFFDLASLTKPLATAMTVMALVHTGRLALDAPIETYLSIFEGTEKAGITARDLLSHCSGLPAWRPYYIPLRRLDPPQRREALRRLLLFEPLEGKPQASSCYSDLGFMLLQWLVEILSAMPLSHFVKQAVYDPLGISTLSFADRSLTLGEKAYAATELCPWRHRLLVGEVHDDNASIMGGCAGQAGLFGTARGVYDLLQGLLAADRGFAGHPLWAGDLIRDFFTRQSGRSWALGFDTPSDTGSSAGTYFSANSVGHLGFTGTSFWMDRDRSVIIILLTNRVHPTRHNQSIRSFRPVFHDALMGSLI